MLRARSQEFSDASVRFAPLSWHASVRGRLGISLIGCRVALSAGTKGFTMKHFCDRPRIVRRSIGGLLAIISIVSPLAVGVVVGGSAQAGMRYVRAPYPGDGTAPSMEQAIAATWPSHLHREALNVAWCESRGRASARNGQYKGHFQMGSSEWRRYGNGSPFNALDNSAAAYRYYRAVGGSWRPWQCQP